ncbi:MAG: DNA-directed RNA polymerase subunit alpha [Dehalococcoidales bacterium]|nr:DNA-directed RNA polymerase subunit alpha [Dehalococcoidales bacterium]
MSQLVIPKAECVESRDNYGRFVAEPLDKDLGVTLGNAMRRILLGHLQGAAVTRIKIEGIQHEFSSIPYVKEDVIEFLLNIKALRLKSLSGGPGKLTLEVEGEKRIYAADIKPSAEFEIANPELYLATLDSDQAKLHVEFDVELGEGYREAGPSGNLPVGVIPVDAIFTPTRKVNFTVEPIHVGQEASRERLFLEVWTDGTISPADAVSRSAEILMEQLSPFVNYVRITQAKTEKELVPSSVSEEVSNMPVEQLNLSVRTINCLRRGGIATVGELMNKQEKELLALRNFGQKSKQELVERLAILGLSLASESALGEKEGKSTNQDEAEDVATEGEEK